MLGISDASRESLSDFKISIEVRHNLRSDLKHDLLHDPTPIWLPYAPNATDMKHFSNGIVNE